MNLGYEYIQSWFRIYTVPTRTPMISIFGSDRFVNKIQTRPIPLLLDRFGLGYLIQFIFPGV